jgi:hypothetical protein
MGFSMPKNLERETIYTPFAGVKFCIQLQGSLTVYRKPNPQTTKLQSSDPCCQYPKRQLIQKNWIKLQEELNLALLLWQNLYLRLTMADHKIWHKQR